eukprot:5880995-Alexandrium_andersonii.AAC.1
MRAPECSSLVNAACPRLKRPCRGASKKPMLSIPSQRGQGGRGGADAGQSWVSHVPALHMWADVWVWRGVVCEGLQTLRASIAAR